MDKKYEHENDISSLRKKIKELEETQQDSSSFGGIIPELNIFLEKLENQKIFESKDINNKLSDYAQNSIQDIKGPLTPYQLFKFLANDDLGKQNKKVLTNIRKYSSDITGVRKQLSELLHKLESHITYTKRQKELDDRFTKKLKKLGTSICDQLANEEKTNEIQSTLDQCLNRKQTPLNKESQEVRHGSNKTSPKENGLDSSASSSHEALIKQAVERSGKRKVMCKSRSKENGIEEITNKLRKRLKLISPESSQD